MDRRALLAVALSFLVLFGSQWVFQKLGWLPAAPKPGAPTTQAPATPGSPNATTPNAGAGLAGTERIVTPGGAATPGTVELTPSTTGSERWVAPATADSVVTVDQPLYTARFRARGARLLSVVLKPYKDGDDGRATLAADPALALDLGSADAPLPLDDAPYAASESTDASGRIARLTFAARDTAGLAIEQTFRFTPEDYRIGYAVAITSDAASTGGPSQYHLTLRSWPLTTERTRLEDLNNLGVTAKVGKDNKRQIAASLRGGAKENEGSIAWLAVHSKYFLLGLVGQNVQGTMSRAALSPGTPVEAHDQVDATMTLPLPAGGRTHLFTLYAGPLDYWKVGRLGMDLEPPHALFFNLFKPFSAFLVWAMKQFHALVHNWGVAILLLSILAKILTHPLQATSMRSMRAMQRIQPELERLRKKHDKDPAKMNTAIMELYKENSINPLAGCLPMVIQMPFFLALYHVLGYSIDLRQAGFLGWITDLSAPDLLFQLGPLPVRVLPLFMLGSMILQMRMSPTDPKQAMTMNMVNVVFLFLFYNLPSGLVLYWTVINLLTALQSWIVSRSDTVPKAKAA